MRVLAILISIVVLGQGFALAGAPRTGTRAKKTSSKACPELLAGVLESSEEEVAEYGDLLETATIDDLLKAGEDNLAFKHPSIVMDAAQRAWAAVRKGGYREILEPNYRAKKIRVWPMLSDGVPEAGGKLVEGQFEVMDRVASHLRDGARGDKSAMKMFHFTGPAGTGKTEALVVIASVMDHLAMTDPNYYQYTFRFQHLEDVPILKEAFGTGAKGENVTYDNPLGRSPIILLSKKMQEAVVQHANPRVRELIDLDARPFTSQDGPTRKILEYLVKHHAAKNDKTSLSESEYHELLRRHVVITRRRMGATPHDRIVGFQGEEPEYSELFFKKNMTRMSIFQMDNPLSYEMGRVMAADGGLHLKDEFFREIGSFRDFYLELIQNRRVHRGQRQEELDAVVFGTSNDESIAKAKEQGTATAQIQRTVTAPMRLNLNPYQIIRIMLQMDGVQNFRTWELGESEVELEPLTLSRFVTQVDQNGRYQGPDGRMGLMYPLGTGEEAVLIAPHSLMLMALTAAGTRLVTDPQKFRAAEKDLKISTDKVEEVQKYALNIVSRLEVLLGRISPQQAVAIELNRASKVLKEGQLGISSRDLQTWFARARQIAIARNESTLTPRIVDLAFKELIDREGMVPQPGDSTASWWKVHDLVKHQLIVPALLNDINQIVSGNSEQVSQLYEEVKAELLALDSNPDAIVYEPVGGDREVPIKKDRLEKIREIYRTQNDGRVLLTKDLMRFHAHQRKTARRHRELEKAIEQYVLSHTVEMSVVESLLSAFRGENAQGDARTQAVAQAARQGISRWGYNERAFYEALQYFQQSQIDLTRVSR